MCVWNYPIYNLEVWNEETEEGVNGSEKTWEKRV